MNMIGILLAAGFSKRFGDANKLMHPLAQGDMLGLMAAKALICAVPNCVAVVRNSDTDLANALIKLGFKVTFCPDTLPNMTDSLRTAIQFCDGLNLEGYIISLADMPFIQPQTIALVAQAIKEGASIAMPTYQGQRGHPVGFSVVHKQALLQLTGDEGARAIVKRHPDAVKLLSCEDIGVISDIDTLEDIEKAKQLGLL
jgi:molybdenum cofactor cytidylyltransferase